MFLFVSIKTIAQNSPVHDTTAKPAITIIGKPDGEKAEMKIGKDGGSISSSDGKAELIIPEGSVTKKTTFSIILLLILFQMVMAKPIVWSHRVYNLKNRCNLFFIMMKKNLKIVCNCLWALPCRIIKVNGTGLKFRVGHCSKNDHRKHQPLQQLVEF